MSLIFTDDRHYHDIADAIRARAATDLTFLPSEMADAILSILTTSSPLEVIAGGATDIADSTRAGAEEIVHPATVTTLLPSFPPYRTTATRRQ